MKKANIVCQYMADNITLWAHNNDFKTGFLLNGGTANLTLHITVGAIIHAASKN